METPGPAPSPEGEPAPPVGAALPEDAPVVSGQVISGQVVPPEPGSARPGGVPPAAVPPADGETGEAPPGRVWPFLFKPRWLAWHLLVAAAVVGMLWLGDWQYHRAMGGNGLSWAYTFEWPLFAVFAVVFWARTIRDEFFLKRGGVSETELIARAAIARSLATLPPGAMLPAGTLPEGMSIRQVEQPLESDADDPELARYNAYLAKLNAKDRRKALGAG